MPCLSTRSAQFGSAPPPVRSASPDGIWSKHLDSIAFDQLHKQEDHSFQQSDRAGTCQSQNNNDFEVLDPSLHPWGGLTTTKHGILTVLDCFMCARSLKTLQNVVERGEEATMSPERLSYPKAIASVRKEVDSEERHSAAEADLPIAKEGTQMQDNR
ncbi:hypothetical protein BHE74_00018267 [Ensete ventricosum]|nr:hypothetical protein BHE74_00018267 [Ensete ventricosum]